MSSRRWLSGLGAIVLVALVWLGDAQLRRHLPALPSALQLGVLVLWVKAVADLLELPVRPKRSTFYYEDYLAEWVHFAILGAVAALCASLVHGLIDRGLAAAPLAIGVYLIWRLTSPHRAGEGRE